MQRILVVGAGRSSSTLIQYLLDHSEENDWQVIVGDYDLSLAEQKIENHPNGKAIRFDVFDVEQRNDGIRNADIVVSMLPPSMHILLAEDCVFQGKNLVTASYVSEDIAVLNDKAVEKGVLLLNEIGLDPGIDHMSAKKVIDDIHNDGGKIHTFKSFCGGLVAPKYDTNPWNYKFTWNPRNVVLAGKGTAQFIRNGQYKYIPYQNLFSRIECIDILEAGAFEGYANRDSLEYREAYDLTDIPTIFRGTLRRPGYCEAWNVFVQLGITDDTYKVSGLSNMTWRDFINSFLVYDEVKTVEEKLQSYLSLSSEVMNKLKWLGIFENVSVGLQDATPAQALQKLLESKWSLEEEDKDMIVMQHQFHYQLNGEEKCFHSSLVLEGKDQIHTAMSMTVGLPLAIATKLILQQKIKLSGVQIPVMKEIYEPVLEELKSFGIDFVEEEI
ncbi:MAG: saccharopine dehydrogenase [Flavobacteriales bacterium]|nr:saccharopine dehydrogenase [Flavobacteriales bacterium]